MELPPQKEVDLPEGTGGPMKELMRKLGEA